MTAFMYLTILATHHRTPEALAEAVGVDITEARQAFRSMEAMRRDGRPPVVVAHDELVRRMREKEAQA